MVLEYFSKCFEYHGNFLIIFLLLFYPEYGLASVDKFGAAFAIGFMAVMLGVMSGLASDTATPDRPGAEQQAAISPPPMPKPVDKESMVGYGDAMKPKPVGDERCWIEDPVTG